MLFREQGTPTVWITVDYRVVLQRDYLYQQHKQHTGEHIVSLLRDFWNSINLSFQGVTNEIQIKFGGMI